MVSRRDYTAEIVEAARSVLLETLRVLGEYQDAIVVVGGWVPELLLSQEEARHVGSIDVDIALDHREIGEVGYRSILQLLQARGYKQGKQPFIFHRSVRIRDGEILVEVDFLSGEYAGTGRTRRTQRVQDLRPRKARGIDLVFELPEKITHRGQLPGGGDDAVEVQVASIASFLVTKGMALHHRVLPVPAPAAKLTDLSIPPIIVAKGTVYDAAARFGHLRSIPRVTTGQLPCSATLLDGPFPCEVQNPRGTRT
jgi:hypothetical protein